VVEIKMKVSETYQWVYHAALAITICMVIIMVFIMSTLAYIIHQERKKGSAPIHWLTTLALMGSVLMVLISVGGVVGAVIVWQHVNVLDG
jgi:ABC-type glycerol-3-phosphate transport system permease component